MTILTTTMMMMRCLVVSRRSSVFCPGATFWEIATSATKSTINIVDSTMFLGNSDQNHHQNCSLNIITVTSCNHYNHHRGVWLQNKLRFLSWENLLKRNNGKRCCQNYQPYISSSFSQIWLLSAQPGIIIITIVIQQQRHCGFLPPNGSECTIILYQPKATPVAGNFAQVCCRLTIQYLLLPTVQYLLVLVPTVLPTGTSTHQYPL